MIRNYFVTAWRHLFKNRLYAGINLLGLTIGLASCILIGIYVWNELSYDRFHANADRIARTTWEYRFQGDVQKVAVTGTKVGPEYKRTFPQVEAFVRLMKYPRVITLGDKMFDEKNFLYADETFFNVFSFRLLSGDPKTVLDAPDKLVITESMAKKYFGGQDPVGKTVKVGEKKQFQITGVAEDAPRNSQIRFDFVGSFSSLNASKTEKYNEANYTTYLLLKDRSHMDFMQTKGRDQMAERVKKEMSLQGSDYSMYNLEPLTSVHLHSELDGLEPNSNILYVYVLSAVAILILLIACVNYTNLSTAQSAGRSTEIGIRKVLGAAKKQVFLQFICESFLLSLVALLLALALSALVLPYFSRVAGRELSFAWLATPQAIAVLLGLVILVALTSGAYPSIVLSNGRIIGILKSGLRLTGSGTLRRSLIIFQFVISAFLIASTIIILQQLNFIQNKDLGYNKDQVIVLPVDYTMLTKYDEIKQVMSAHPSIISVGGAYEEPTHIGWADGLNK
ncbi:MAG TPA: ABC transporter permease, partial [Flavisolibacter sp.]|nr:ABC transporter permease [Flavisolibacter sp.]